MSEKAPRESILILDDALPNLRLLSDLLGRRGHKVRRHDRLSLLPLRAKAMLNEEAAMSPDDGGRPRQRSHGALIGHYIVAVAATALAGAAREALTPLLHTHYPFTTFYVAVAVNAWIGGFGPGVFSTLLSELVALWFWRPDVIEGDALYDLTGAGLFLGAGIAISWLIESQRSSLLRARRANAKAKAARMTAETARARAEAAVLAREEIQAIVAHDLRNPLGVITLSSALLQKTEVPGPEGEQIRRRAGQMSRAAERMSALIRDLLDAASIEAGALSIEPDHHDVSDTIQEAVEAAEPLANAKGIALECELPGEAHVWWDRHRVLQALGNLLGNAIKFTPEGGQIRIRAVLEADRVRVSISDTGPGIPAALLPHIFERFSKGKRSAGSGTGLGLFIANGIVRAHGGEIEVQSRAGDGTTFSVVIPRAKRSRHLLRGALIAP